MSKIVNNLFVFYSNEKKNCITTLLNSALEVARLFFRTRRELVITRTRGFSAGIFIDAYKISRLFT